MVKIKAPMVKNKSIKYGDRERIKSQSTLEYTMVIVCLVAALLGMQIYIKRSVQGRLRDAADQVGQQYSTETSTSSMVQKFESNATITGDTQIIAITDPVTGDTELREILVTHRKEDQTLKQEAGSYEETGALSEEGLFK